MKLSYSSVLALLGTGTAQFTWPSAYDELEDVMFLNTGYKSRGFSSFITPCSFSANGVGRQTAAEWLRTGFHDMSTANVFFAPHGGIDGSLAFELNDGENIGAGFNSSFVTYSGFYNTRLSISDLVALGVYASVRQCGGPIIPMRGGRVDATAAGPLGVPQPQNGAGTFSNQFARMGFNSTDMIQMTACGHTLGGVHAGNFPQIVAAGTAPNDFQLFDNTEGWDNGIATRYINGPDTDPLAVGISVSSGRNSDFAVFNIDKNVTLKSMLTESAFDSQCSAILQRMIEVVDPALVNLSSIIQPYEVKPSGMQLTLLAGGTQLRFGGDIRVRTTTRSAASITAVQLVYKEINGAAGGTINAATTPSGTANGFDDTFTFYSFNTTLPLATSISAFNVQVSSNGLTQTYNNGGSGFPVSDSVIVQTTQSCRIGGTMKVVAAVRSTVTTPVSMTLTQKLPRNQGSPIPSPVPFLNTSSLVMTKGVAIGPYNLYSGSVPVSEITGAKYGVSAAGVSDGFKDVAALGAVCAASPPAAASTSSSTVSSTKTSSSTSKSSTLTTKTSSSSSTSKTSSSTSQSSTISSTITSKSSSSSSSTSKSSTLSSTSKTSSSSSSNSGSSTSSSTLSTSKTSSTLSSSTTKSSTSGSSSSLISSTTTSTGIPSSVSTSTTASPTLAIQPSVGSYTFQGCFSEGDGVRALDGPSYVNYTSMTLEICASSCSGYNYWGVEYGGECYCGNALAASSTRQAIQDCSFTCPGNSYEYCGAGNRLELYLLTSVATASRSSTSSTSKTSTSTTTSVSPTATIAVKQKVRGYTFKGCYTEAKNARALSGSQVIDYNSMTLELCAGNCTGYAYFGVEYFGECYCGNVINAGSVAAAASGCSFACPGNQYEYCGGQDRIEMYHNTSAPTATSTSTTSSTPTPTPSIKATVGAYKYYNCITEATNVRALADKTTSNYTSMTLETCGSFCTGYKYWGVEYGGECYCGSAFGAGSVNATAGDCSFSCPGDGTEFCGASDRLSTYYLP